MGLESKRGDDDEDVSVIISDEDFNDEVDLERDVNSKTLNRDIEQLNNFAIQATNNTGNVMKDEP